MNSNLEHEGLQKLKEALKVINQWEYENLHLETLEEVIPSPRYQKRMERLIKRQNQSYWKYVNTVRKRVAVFAVAIALAFALSMSVSAVREPIVEFFVNVYERFVEFFYDEDDIARAPDTIETVYTLGYVPEGYEIECFEIRESMACWRWIGTNKDKIAFSQYIFEGDYFLDGEESDFEILYVENLEVAYICKNSMKKFYWNTPEYAFQLMLSDNFSKQECLRIITLIEEISDEERIRYEKKN